MSTYEDAGFNEFLIRPDPNEQKEILEDESSITIKQPASSVKNYGETEGEAIKIDWENGSITFSSKSRSRVVIGKVEESGQWGIKIYNADGTVGFSQLFS